MQDVAWFKDCNYLCVLESIGGMTNAGSGDIYCVDGFGHVRLGGLEELNSDAIGSWSRVLGSEDRIL